MIRDALMRPFPMIKNMLSIKQSGLLLALLLPYYLYSGEPTHLANLLAKSNIVVIAETKEGNTEEKPIKVLRVIKGKIMTYNLTVQRKGKGKKDIEDPLDQSFFDSRQGSRWLLFLSWYYGVILSSPSPAAYPAETGLDNVRIELIDKMLPIISSREKNVKMKFLKDLLNSKDEVDEEAGLELLGTLDINIYFEFFLELMASPKKTVRAKTSQYLQEIRSVDLNRKLYATLEKSKNDTINYIILDILIKKKSKTLPKYLIGYLKSEDPRLRELALIGLEQARYVEGLQDILLMVADPDPNVRIEAINTLNSLGIQKLTPLQKEKIVDFLFKAIEDSDVNVRIRAIEAFPQIISDPYKKKEFLSITEGLLASEYEEERAKAARVINNSGYFSFITTLRLALMYIFDRSIIVRREVAPLGIYQAKNILAVIFISIIAHLSLLSIAFLAERKKRFKLIFTITLNKYLWGLLAGFITGTILSIFHAQVGFGVSLIHILLFWPSLLGFTSAFLCLVPIILSKETNIPTYHFTFLLGIILVGVCLVLVNLSARFITVFIGFPFILWFPLRPYPFKKKKTRYIIAFFLGFLSFVFTGIWVALVAGFVSTLWARVYKDCREMTA